MKKIAVIIGILAVVLVVLLSAGCISQINSVAKTVDPVIGSWESSYGTSYLDLNYNGHGTKTVLGMTSSISWSKSGTSAYIIDGSRYTLSGNTLKGPIATYHRT